MKTIPRSHAKYELSYIATGSQKEEYKEYFYKRAEEAGFNKKDILETRIGGAILAHTGPNMYLASYRKVTK